MGNTPNGLPICLPGYLIDIMEASSRVLYALMRKLLKEGGPGYLVERMPEGWLTEAMADRLYAYYLETEPDMAFDVLVKGVHAPRGITFDDFKKTGDYLSAKILEAQTVDTYYGWVREFLRGARLAGITDPGHHFHNTRGPDGRRYTDEELDREVIATLNYPFEHEPESIWFLEVDPEKQASAQNLLMMADAMSGGDLRHRPVILDPRDVEFRDGKLYATKPGTEREIKKAISRIVDVDLKAYIKAREADGQMHVIERFKRFYAEPALWGDLAKHLMGFYYADKRSLTQICLLDGVNVAPKTIIISDDDMARYRKDPSELDRVAVKPLHGMSAKGVIVAPTLAELEKAMSSEPMLAQELFWATPLMPDINPELTDPDARAGVCCEARLVMHAGYPCVKHNPHRARLIAGLSRTHYQSKDPKRRVKDDPKGRGWYSNMGAIMAVKAELGMSVKDDAGLGMSPIYWNE
jgi:hypothetical protein